MKAILVILTVALLMSPAFGVSPPKPAWSIAFTPSLLGNVEGATLSDMKTLSSALGDTLIIVTLHYAEPDSIVHGFLWISSKGKIIDKKSSLDSYGTPLKVTASDFYLLSETGEVRKYIKAKGFVSYPGKVSYAFPKEADPNLNWVDRVEGSAGFLAFEYGQDGNPTRVSFYKF